MRTKDETGNRYGRLTILGYAGYSIRNRAAWKCLCDCGNEVVRDGATLRNHTRLGKTQQSCGCWKREISSANGKATRTHGFSKGSNRKLYDVHRQMMRRCYDQACKDYPCYGGRGIAICDAWHDRATFIAWAHSSGYEEGVTIERINVNGNYEPDNCTWIVNERQALNTRRCVYLTHDGQTHTLSDWARILGMSVRTLIQRKNRGWSVERILTERSFRGKNQTFSDNHSQPSSQ